MQTPWGPVRVKRSLGYGAEKAKPEYEELRQLALDAGIGLDEARAMVDKLT